MLYEMLTGRLPFEGETPVFVAIQHINSIPIAPRDLNPEIPEGLEAITLKAMAPNPDQRYLSAEAFLADLKEFRRNPGAPVPQPADKLEDEVEEPTMVMPVSTINAAAKEDAEKKAEESDQSVVVESMQVESQSNAEPVVKEKKGKKGEEGDDYVAPPRRGLPPALIGFFAVILFLCAVGYFLYSFLLKDILTPPEEYKIPDLRGYTVEQLSNNPSVLAGFTIEVSHTISDSEYEAGEICRQQPAANDTVKDSDTVIYVTVSSGEEQMYMPDIINMEARAALQLLQNDMKLKVKQTSDYSDDIAKGYIMGCTLLEGTLLEKGDEVTITISKGPKPITINVIPFIDVNIETARSQAEGLGLVVEEPDYYYSDLYAADRVIWQSIPADTVVEPGTVIKFWVSLGPESGPDDPVVSPDPTPSTEIPLPTTGVEALPSVRTIDVDLSGFEGIVMLRIVVGEMTIHDSAVNCAETPTISRTVEGTGVQTVQIYINEELTNSYELDFNS
jgi:serine/threonine-protein kinase